MGDILPQFVSEPHFVSQSVTATGAVGPLYMLNGMLEVSGTFVGTINIQMDVNGDGVFTNATDTSGNAIALSAPGVLCINNAVTCQTQAYCSAYTSGTIVVSIRGV